MQLCTSCLKRGIFTFEQRCWNQTFVDSNIDEGRQLRVLRSNNVLNIQDTLSVIILVYLTPGAGGGVGGLLVAQFLEGPLSAVSKPILQLK